MKRMNNRQKMTVKANQNIEKFLQETQKIQKTGYLRRAAGKKINSRLKVKTY